MTCYGLILEEACSNFLCRPCVTELLAEVLHWPLEAYSLRLLITDFFKSAKNPNLGSSCLHLDSNILSRRRQAFQLF